LIAAAAIAGWLILPAPALARHGDVRDERTSLGDWRLDIARDRFSGGVACRLAARDHRALYRAQAVAFDLRQAHNPGRAVYRIDGGPPRASRDDLPGLIAANVPMDRGSMDNPKQGLVWVPLAVLATGNSIAIEPGPGQRIRRFHYRGLVALHAIAVERGCAPESRFVER
jgi:hypothetical protein